LHDFADERELALADYHAALAINGAPEAARVAAQRGIDAPYSPPAANGGGDKPKQ
jgi:hypothetical protein